MTKIKKRFKTPDQESYWEVAETNKEYFRRTNKKKKQKSYQKEYCSFCKKHYDKCTC